MPGVTVAVKGQTRGTITSTDGSYQIQVNGNESLIFSFVGYETVTIPVNKRKVINVELKETTQMVDEVVITVPYGTAKKSTFTGSASYIAAGTIEKAQVSSVSKALQGTVAGLQSFSSSGQPGSDATILIRGVGSVNASTRVDVVIHRACDLADDLGTVRARALHNSTAVAAQKQRGAEDQRRHGHAGDQRCRQDYGAGRALHGRTSPAARARRSATGDVPLYFLKQ